MEPTAVTETPAPSTPKTPVPKFKAPKKKKKWPKVLLVLLVISALVGWFFVRPMMSAGQQMLSAVYRTDTAQLRDMTVSVSSTGAISPADTWQATALAAGEVLSAPFAVGDTVQKGDVLFRLDDSDARTALRRAEIALQQAQLAYDDLVSKQEDLYEDTDLLCDADGLLVKLYVEAGDTVAVGSPIADVLDRTTMELNVPFHTVDAAAFTVGQSAVITVDGSPETLDATVSEISFLDEVGAGGALIRTVTLSVPNPGGLTDTLTGTAVVGEAACVASGPFSYATQTTVTAKTGGELETLLVEEGDTVADGQLLGTFTVSSMDTQLENARLNVETADISLQSARDALDNYVVTSPISGTVVAKHFEKGDTVDSSSLAAAGGALATVYDLSALTFEMKISELDINKIQAGQEVSITTKAVEGRTYTGTVEQVYLSGVTLSGMTDYPIKVVVHEPEDLKPGMNVSADVIVEEAGTVLTVPVEAVKQGSQSPYVTVAGEGALDESGAVIDPTKLERRGVTLGRNDESYIEVTAGLSEGDVVVWENQATNPFAAMMNMGM